MTYHEVLDEELRTFIQQIGVERVDLNVAGQPCGEEDRWWLAYCCKACHYCLLRIDSFTRGDLFVYEDFKATLAVCVERHICSRRVDLVEQPTRLP